MAIYDAPESLHVGNGVETVFGFNWPYLLPRDLLVTVNGQPVPTVLASPNQVAIVPAPAALSIVRIYRNTPAQNPTYLFATGIPMLPKYIDGNNKQLLYALQEGLLQFAATQDTADAALAAAEAAQLAATEAAASAAQQAASIRRTVRVGSVDPELQLLPTVAARALKVLGFDAQGNPVGVVPQTGSGTELALDLASPSDGRGAAMVGYNRELRYAPLTVGAALGSTFPNPWEFAHLLTYTPGIDPGGWDWSPVINHILQHFGGISLGRGRFGVGGPVLIRPGYRILGVGPGHAGGFAYTDIFSTVLVALATFSGAAVLTGDIQSPENVLTAPQLEQFKLDLSQCSSHGIKLESVYDGARMVNLHVVGTPPGKYALYCTGGAYGLGQTLLALNCQFLRRPNSTELLGVARFEGLNESQLIGCKFFGSAGGVLASAGPAVEFAGCSGLTMVGVSTAFSADGVAIVDHPTRKTIGFTMESPTFEAHTRTAVTIRCHPSRKATQVYIKSPRYYDSVFTMLNAIDVDNVERGDFQCQFKRAIVGPGSDQNTVYTQRQSYLTDNGVNTLIISTPNASDPYYGVNKRIRSEQGITSIGTMVASGGLAVRVATFTAASGSIPDSGGVILVDRATIGRYVLPSAAAMGAGYTAEVVVRCLGAGTAELSALAGQTVNGVATYTVAAGTTARLVSNGVGSWYVL